ncbi:MAG: hypothetical protein FWE42_06805 [Defluviitaleaceae bacterium]|nr:hypothetical protein [Defluviitaleaceae bacterium]
MEYSQDYSGLISSPKKREKLYKQVVSGHYTKPPGSPKVAVIVLSIIGIVFLLIGLASPFFLIIGLLSFVLIPVLVRARRKMNVAHAQRAVKLTQRYGGADMIMEEVRQHLENPSMPSFSVSSEESDFHLVGPWFLDPNGKTVLNTSEIVGIVGLMGQGTFLILDDETTETVMFGAHQWGDVFSLFCETNPYILYSDDPVTLPDGRVVDTADAFKGKHFGAIVAAHVERKTNE